MQSLRQGLNTGVNILARSHLVNTVLRDTYMLLIREHFIFKTSTMMGWDQVRMIEIFFDTGATSSHRLISQSLRNLRIPQYASRECQVVLPRQNCFQANSFPSCSPENPFARTNQLIL